MSSNEKLQAVYNQMHTQGPTAWFSDGSEEREAILRAGSPWTGLRVLEIGCGAGKLARRMHDQGAVVVGIDYAEEAIAKAQLAGTPECIFVRDSYRNLCHRWDRIVMQGVLEHLDNPWTELEWMIDNLLTPEGDIITSSPCFCNPRGIVWMTLATLFDAPMSLTDLHFLHPWEFLDFAEEFDLEITTRFCDVSWGNDEDMIADYKDRLPKVFPGMDKAKITRLIDWLEIGRDLVRGEGATAVYHLSRK
jgi:SAM-dependent methyltransferase